MSTGDVLTSLSILLSAATFLFSWAKDRAIERKTLADRVRVEAARTLSGIDRRLEISKSFFTEIQPLFVETSELLAQRRSIVLARDHLWKGLSAFRSDLRRRVVAEDLEGAYSGLYAYDPTVRDRFRDALQRLDSLGQNHYSQLLEETQTDVFSFAGRLPSYQTADLGNALRATTGRRVAEYERAAASAVAPLEHFLSAIVTAPDRDLLRQPQLARLQDSTN